MKKYMCHSGYVYSQHDNQKHKITAPEIARLYGVNGRECIYVNGRKDQLRGLNQERLDDFIHLYPKYRGSYTLPTEKGGLDRDRIFYN